MDFKGRINKLRKIFSEAGCSGFFIDDPLNILYLTGCHLTAGKVFVGEIEAHLIVDGRYYELCKKQSPIPVLKAEEIPLKELLAPLATVGFDSNIVTHQQFLELQKVAPQTTFHPMNACLQRLRSVKESSELEALRTSAAFAVEGARYLSTLLIEGITEKELAIALEIFWKQQGSQALSFDPIIAFGPNSSMPHYRAGTARLQKGQHVLIDIGVQFHDYHSDLTRIVYFGDPDPKIKEIEEIVVAAYQRAIDMCRAGVRVGDLDLAARDHIASKGYGDYFTHSLGHGVGLEIHEFPLIRDREPFRDVILEAGMVITIEPGIYLPGIGGVRYENTVIVSDAGCEVITK